MDNAALYNELVIQAQGGNSQSRNRLAELVHGPLRSYVLRRTLRLDLTDEIVQESIIEMFKILGKLQKPDRFWPWLCKIALNKVRSHHRREQRRKTVLRDHARQNLLHTDTQEEVAGMVSQELKQIVLSAIGRLKLKHREILALRCYEDRNYAQIAEELGCSELSARVLFYRAKKALEKQLSRNGLGKGALLTALITFGKMTAPSRAAAASITLTPSLIKVGAGAALVGLTTGKAALVTLAAGGLLAAGAFVGPSLVTSRTAPPSSPTPLVNQSAPADILLADPDYRECWYYYPDGPDQAVMLRLVRSNPRSDRTYCQWLQNNHGNYFYDPDQNTVYLNNYHMWRRDLSVMRLPTDPPDLRNFISQIEGRYDGSQALTGKGPGLLIITRRSGHETSHTARIPYHYNVLEEEYSRYNWPAGTRLVDRRDRLRRLGWGYVIMDGKLAGHTVRGFARIPFVHETLQSHPPLLQLNVGPHLQLIDAPGGTGMIEAATGRVIIRYPRGTWFAGLLRPWWGLHAVDTVRRDAARANIAFESQYRENRQKVQITLYHQNQKGIYLVDMENDWIESVSFALSDSRGGERENVLSFAYGDTVPSHLPVSEPKKLTGSAVKDSPGIRWLFDIARGDGLQ